MKQTPPSFAPSGFLHVAVGVIKNAQGDILISQRATDAHQGGLWEFPGGKVESGESVEQALRRELQEELEICAERSQPLITVRHHYPDLSVLLDVWSVDAFSGVAKGSEGQEIRWVAANELNNYDFPAANLPIVRAVQLPCFYAVLDDADSAALMDNLRKILSNGIQLMQLRLKRLSAPAVEAFLNQAVPLCGQYNAQLLLNSGVKNAANFQQLGVHLTSEHLMKLEARPQTKGWVAASCHNLAQLRKAEQIGVDFAVLAPVLKTQTHPDAIPLGWDCFAQWVAEANIPVYALGGLGREDENTAKAFGGQGIAGIRTFLG